MRCIDFLERYSDYRDGLIADPAEARLLEAHLGRCPRCRRYDAHVARGVMALRSTSDLEPSRWFRARLRARLAAREPVTAPVIPAPAGVMLGLMVLAAGLLVWSGLERDRAAIADAEPAATSRALPVAVANPGIPFVAFTTLSVPAFGGWWRAPGAASDPLLVPAARGR